MPTEHPRETLDKIYAESKTGEMTATITKRDGVTPVPLANLDTLTLTLFLEETGAIINSRLASDILGTGGGTVHATTGVLTLVLAPLDMVTVDTDETFEMHVALIEWTYDGTGQAGGQEIAFRVRNFAKVS